MRCAVSGRDGATCVRWRASWPDSMRLRIARYRVIFHYVARPGGTTIRCEFAEERSIVYQLYAEMARHLQVR
jgi:hypothetical protein